MSRVIPVVATGLVAIWLGGCAPSPSTHMAEPLGGNWTVALLPLANYTTHRDAPTQLLPLITLEFRTRMGFTVVDMARVEEALTDEPWLMSDRIPPDLADTLGADLNADALVLGSVLAYGYRPADGLQIPTVSISLRMIEVPGGELLWSAVHSRDGADRESVFGWGRNESLTNLALETIREMLKSLPEVAGPNATGVRLPPGRGDMP